MILYQYYISIYILAKNNVFLIKRNAQFSFCVTHHLICNTLEPTTVILSFLNTISLKKTVFQYFRKSTSHSMLFKTSYLNVGYFMSAENIGGNK